MLFTIIRRLDAADRRPSLDGGTLRNPIAVMAKL